MRKIKFSILEEELVWFIRINTPSRNEILRHDFHPATLKQVQKAFTKLRRAGIIYKTDDNWYQVNSQYRFVLIED